MKYSIKKQFILIYVALIICLFGFGFLLNSIFLSPYYTNNKMKSLKDAYRSINDASNSGDIASDEFDVEIKTICAKYNINMLIMDEKTATVKSSMSDDASLWRQLLDNVFGVNSYLQEQKNGDEEDTFKIDDSIQPKLLEVNEQYSIQRAKDRKTNSEYLEMWGFLDNGNLFILRSPLDSIKDSVMISNHFFAYIALFGIVIGVILITLITDRITEPIRRLTDISTDMKRLDFNAKYNMKSKNELAILGQNMNELSEILEKTISELKTANNELKVDLEKKQQIEEMRKEFLSNVTHELKTPIALIQGYAEGLRDGVTEDPDSLDFYCEVIADEASKMNNMVKKLLTMSQFEAGEEMMVMERLDIALLINNYIQSADILIRQKNADVRIQSVGTVNVWADEFGVEEVFANYFTNAINHLSGEKIIDVKIIENESTVRISVFNTGSQIPEMSIDRIWEKFYKVDKARTREYGGSGVGLSIVKAIMDAMHQPYGVQNYENGVEFWFELEKA